MNEPYPYSDSDLASMWRNFNEVRRELIDAGFHKKESALPQVTPADGGLPALVIHDVHGIAVHIGFHKKAIFVSTVWQDDPAVIFQALSPRRVAERMLQEVKDFEVRTRLGCRAGFSADAADNLPPHRRPPT